MPTKVSRAGYVAGDIEPLISKILQGVSVMMENDPEFRDGPKEEVTEAEKSVPAAEQCGNHGIHNDQCGNSCIRPKGHIQPHKCILGHTWYSA